MESRRQHSTLVIRCKVLNTTGVQVHGMSARVSQELGRSLQVRGYGQRPIFCGFRNQALIKARYDSTVEESDRPIVAKDQSSAR